MLSESKTLVAEVERPTLKSGSAGAEHLRRLNWKNFDNSCECGK